MIGNKIRKRHKKHVKKNGIVNVAVLEYKKILGKT